MRIATLNVQNLRLYDEEGGRHLHGAWDSDEPEEESLDPIDRRLTAELLHEIDADVVALQEVFDIETLDYFHDQFLLPAGVRAYPHRICEPGNDGRGLDVALLSRLPIDTIHSHAALTPADINIGFPPALDPTFPIFRRDCLEASIGPVTLFICHFKSPYPDVEKAWATRRGEALATRWLIEQRFNDPSRGMWLVLGDLNEPGDTGPGEARAVLPLEGEFTRDLLQRLPVSERWTYFDPHSGSYHCPDVLLASPALADQWSEARPIIMRKGLGKETGRYHGKRLAGVGQHRPHASDHAAIVLDLPGI